jgi:energy-coupling factor transporter ATP-binding protein EcfA2
LPTRGIASSYDEETKLYTFKKEITFSRIGGRTDTAERQWNTILKRLLKAGMKTIWGKYPWSVETEGIDKIRTELELTGSIPVSVSKAVIKDIAPISLDAKEHYADIYDRNDQIKIVRSAIVAGNESDWQDRFHCLLYGPPGCGKSAIIKATKCMLGKENEAYMEFDATSTTEAGAQKILLGATHIHPVLFIEEIEKQDEKMLRWLLGLLDYRAEIRKTNFRIGTQVRSTKMLLFKKVLTGALVSRFAHEIYCPRPNRMVLQKILEREVAKTKNGNQKWIEPTLEYCYDKKKWDDPRKIIPVCLCGRDSLLDNSYQASLDNIQFSNSKVL